MLILMVACIHLTPQVGFCFIPASGFALYLDYLMNMIKPEAIAGQMPRRIMVRVPTVDTDAMKEAFEVAGSLREAGYTVEFDLDGKKPDGVIWVIDVSSRAPLFTVNDLVKDRKVEVRAVAEVLKLLEGEGGDKDSPA